MVRDDDGQDRHRFLAKRRRALRRAADSCHVPVDVQHVVGACLAAHVVLRTKDELGARERAHMHDVKAAARLGCPLDGVADRRNLCLDRTRLDEVDGRRTSWLAQLRGVFRMYQED